MAPLADLLKKEVECIWSTPQEQSFQKLKAALCQASTLAYSDVSRTFVVHLDTSHVAMSVTLPQNDASCQQCLLNCASRKFDSAERNYPTNELELMAMVFAFKHWKHYQMGSHTIAYTVSSFLKLLTTLKTPSPSVVRWMADLSLYTYEVRHIPVSTNTAAGALSRMYPE